MRLPQAGSKWVSCRIGVTTTLAGGFLRRLIADYKMCHPRIVIEVHDGSRRHHLAGVRSRTLDVAFVVGADTFSACLSATLWSERIYVALASGHNLARCEHLDWNALKEQRFIATQADPGPEIKDYIRRRVAVHGAAAAVCSQPVSAAGIAASILVRGVR